MLHTSPRREEGPMSQLPHHRWRPNDIRQLLLVVGIVLALALVLMVICGYLFRWKWTGVMADTGYPWRTLWDWLGLLIVPVVLAIGGYLFNSSQNRATQEATDERTKADRAIADQ